MKKTTLIISGLIWVAYQTVVMAAYYPSDFYYSEAGFNQSTPLQQKLSTTRGEYFFKKTGLYFGASDTVYQERISDEEYSEMDAYAGIKQNYGNFGYHLGLRSYNRSIVKNIEVQEAYIGGSFLGIGLGYATNTDGEYRQFNFKHKLSFATIGFHIGRTTLFLGDEFSDWSIQASKTYKKMKFNAIMTKSEDPTNNDTQFNFGVERAISLF